MLGAIILGLSFLLQVFGSAIYGGSYPFQADLTENLHYILYRNGWMIVNKKDFEDIQQDIPKMANAIRPLGNHTLLGQQPEIQLQHYRYFQDALARI